MKALVALELDHFSVEDVDIAGPRTGEVLIRMKAAGICHSDLSVANGTVPMPLPMVLGHEGAGVVVEIGTRVTNVSVGDHVVLSFVPACGECWFCVHQEPHLCVRCDAGGRMWDGTSRLQFRGQELGAMSQLGCLAQYAVVPAASVLPIDRSIPFECAALVGCAAMTGVGAVTNTAGVAAGSTVAVFGCGGVGLGAIQAARLVGAKQIIAVDLGDNKLEYARRFGATHCLKASDGVVAEVRALAGGWGVDYSFEMTGRPAVMQQAYAAARRGGSVCIVGIGRYTEAMQVNALLVASEGKRILGCFYGNANFRVDMPNLLALYQAKRLDLGGLITQTYRIEDAPRGFADLENGRNARGLVLFE